MPYFPVDDDMPFHPKVLAAGNEAMGMWARAGALCKKFATGGLVSAEMAASLGPKKLATALVKVGLWDASGDGYMFHDWDHQAGNADAETEKKRKDANAARQRKWRATNTSRNGVTDDVTNAVSDGAPSPSPILITDMTHLGVVSPVGDAPEHETDQGLLDRLRTQALAEAQRLGITDLAEVRDWLEKASGVAMNMRECVELIGDILARARGEVREPDRYIIGVCRKSPGRIVEYAASRGLGAVA